MNFLYQRMLTHYRLGPFSHVRRRLKNDLIVCHGDPPGSGVFTHYDDSVPVTTHRLKNRWIWGETLVWQNFRSPVRAFGMPEVVIYEGSLRIASLLPALFYFRRNGVPFIIWGQAGSRRRSLADSWQPAAIAYRKLVRNVDAFITYTEEDRAVLSQVTDSAKIFVANNALDTHLLDKLRRDLELEGKDAVKHRLGYKRAHYVCFSGRLRAGKNPQKVFEVVRLLKLEGTDVGVIIIGGGPEAVRLDSYARAHAMEDVHMLGEISDWGASAPHLFAADAMFIPNEAGLSINHGMSFGLPVVTMEAGPGEIQNPAEVSYIQNGKTGYVVPAGDLHGAMAGLRVIFEHQEQFRANCLKKVSTDMSVDQFADGFEAAVSFVQ